MHNRTTVPEYLKEPIKRKTSHNIIMNPQPPQSTKSSPYSDHKHNLELGGWLRQQKCTIKNAVLDPIKNSGFEIITQAYDTLPKKMLWVKEPIKNREIENKFKSSPPKTVIVVVDKNSSNVRLFYCTDISKSSLQLVNTFYAIPANRMDDIDNKLITFAQDPRLLPLQTSDPDFIQQTMAKFQLPSFVVTSPILHQGGNSPISAGYSELYKPNCESTLEKTRNIRRNIRQCKYNPIIHNPIKLVPITPKHIFFSGYNIDSKNSEAGGRSYLYLRQRKLALDTYNKYSCSVAKTPGNKNINPIPTAMNTFRPTNMFITEPSPDKPYLEQRYSNFIPRYIKLPAL